MSESPFSESYAQARQRFREAATAVGAEILSYPMDDEDSEELSIDVAAVGTDDGPTVVTSSGVHGAEGFFGSAVQLALLERLKRSGSKQPVRHILIHSVNPYGFARVRRFNEDNVDLNRNFLGDVGNYKGAPEGYAGLNRFLNPESPPSRFELFKLKALWNIWRYGKQSLKQAVAGGQYEYPRGIFFGGQGPCRSTRIVQDNCDSWLGASQRVMHIDFHTGLGPFGTYKLLLAENAACANLSWYQEAFGAECVEPLDMPTGTAYRVSGLFGAWMQEHFKSREYWFVGAEFGTYDVVRVLSSIRTENRAHHFADASSAVYRAAKEELLECFCPKDPSWRKQVVESGLEIIAKGEGAIK